jgi:RNA polymerase sigma-70 factor, ECF subfamily
MIEYEAVDRELRPRIAGYFRWLAGEDEFEDLAQETMIRIQRGLAGLRDAASLAPWAFSIARNVLLDHGKRPDRSIAISRDLAAESFLLAQGSRYPEPEAQVLREETRECIRSLIGRMTETNRLVLLLSEFDGLSAAEIAAALDISVPNAKIRIHRSRKAFKETIEGGCRVFIDENSRTACQPLEADATELRGSGPPPAR